jgi:hypothetical protein
MRSRQESHDAHRRYNLRWEPLTFSKNLLISEKLADCVTIAVSSTPSGVARIHSLSSAAV